MSFKKCIGVNLGGGNIFVTPYINLCLDVVGY